jgi:hypothetical protein
MTNAARDFSKLIDPLGFQVPSGVHLGAADIANLLDHAEGTKSSISWAIGDIVNYARGMNDGDSWINHLTHRVTLRTLNNYASISSKFSRERRHANLSFRHHDAVKGLEPEQADEWLDKAECQELSSDDLRQAIKDVAALERRTVIGHVGSIDKLLRLDMGLEEGFEVKIVYTVVLEAA